MWINNRRQDGIVHQHVVQDKYTTDLWGKHIPCLFTRRLQRFLFRLIPTTPLSLFSFSYCNYFLSPLQPLYYIVSFSKSVIFFFSPSLSWARSARSHTSLSHTLSHSSKYFIVFFVIQNMELRSNNFTIFRKILHFDNPIQYT